MKKTTFYLIALLALIMTNIGAIAQTPGGLTPMVGSTHSYTVTPGGANTLLWSVSPGSGYTIISATNSSTVNIKWTQAGTYSLTFTETNGTTCYTKKEVSVKVDPNTFDVYATIPAVTCNAAELVINPPTSYVNHVTIAVGMTTSNTSWSPNWEFSFGLVGNNGTISNVKVGGVDQSGSGPYTITNILSTSGKATVNVECDITGDPTSAQTVVLTINSARELTYNTPSNVVGNQSVTQTINAIPNTSAISAN